MCLESLTLLHSWQRFLGLANLGYFSLLKMLSLLPAP